MTVPGCNLCCRGFNYAPPYADLDAKLSPPPTSITPLFSTTPIALYAASDYRHQPIVFLGSDVIAQVFQLIKAYQEKAARLPPIEEVRTILDHSIRGMLYTFSQKHEGYPSGSMVDFACDSNRSPIIAVSNLAVHTKFADTYAKKRIARLQEIFTRETLQVPKTQAELKELESIHKVLELYVSCSCIVRSLQQQKPGKYFASPRAKHGIPTS
ncbi:hypothetical protein L2E82_22449 [Cichorium intybus]|uniref:Uncharacterized protein n=1 Tax=Cichorium intybus TaxID=13427 RepID=A0ACB9DXT6_CICIN|nr:hypothetical protein L2E82_22449 [Cichorium intybus]